MTSSLSVHSRNTTPRLPNALRTMCQHAWPHTASLGSVLGEMTFYQQQFEQKRVLSATTQHHDVVVIDEAGQRVGQLRVTHSAAGIDQLTTWLCQIGDIATCPDHLARMIETSNGVLITALLEHGLSVYPVNPKMVDHGRKPSGAKTDAIDALILAHIGRSDLPKLRQTAHVHQTQHTTHDDEPSSLALAREAVLSGLTREQVIAGL
jgi:transposase